MSIRRGRGNAGAMGSPETDGLERGRAGLLRSGMRAVNLFAPELLNRMKFNPIGRTVKASILSLAMALGVTACSNDYTVSYVYMTTSKTLPHGLINAYQVDYQSGYLRSEER